MIEKIIELSVKNKFLVILATLFIIAAGIYAIVRTPLDAIPDLSDVQVIILTEYPGQAPQVVEDQVTYPLTTAMLSVPFAKVVRGLFLFRHLFCLHYFRGRHRHVLGPQPGAGVPELCGRPSAPGGYPFPGPRCHRRGLGLRVHPRERPPRPGPAALHPGLVSALRTDQRAGGVRGGLHRRICQAVPGGRGPQQAEGLQHPHPEDPHGHQAQQQ